MELNRARAKINKIDKEIVRLLEKRFNLVNEIGCYKRKQRLPIYDNVREKLVVEACINALDNKDYSKYVDDIYFQIMKSCKDIQNSLKEEKCNIVLIGMPGSGKTTIGMMLSIKLNMDFFDIDKYIVTKENKSIIEMFEISEDYFRNKETECAKILGNKSSLVISTGGGIIKRKENMDYLKQNSIIVFLNRPPEKIIEDIDIKTRPLLREGQDKVYTLYNERLHLYKKYCNIEIVNDKTIDEAVNEIIDELTPFMSS